MSSRSRSKSFLSNTAGSLSLQFTNIIVGFIIPQMLIRTYGSQTNGLVTSLTQLVTYINLVEAGISAAAVFALYGPLAKNDMHGVSIIVSSAKRFYYKSGALFVAGSVVLAVAYPIFVSVEVLDRTQVLILVFALCATGFLDFFTLAKYRVLLTASQRNWIIQLATILYKLLYTAIIFTFASLGFSVEVVYVIAVIPIVLRSLLLILVTRRMFPDVSFNLDAKGFKLDQRWDALYLQILGVVQTGAPTIIATFLLRDLSQVSVLSVFLLVANGIRLLCSSLSQGTQASFGDVIARGEIKVLQKAFREFQVAAYAVTTLLCGVALALITPFVRLYAAGVTEVNYDQPLIGYLAILSVFLFHMKTPQGLLVISAGLYRDTRVQTSVQALILIIAGIIFGSVWGIPGILLGACLSDFYRDIDLAFYIPKHVTHTPPSETLKYMGASFLAFALIAIPYLIVSPPCGTWLAWVMSGACLMAWGVLVVLVLLWLTAREQMRGLIGRLRRLIGMA